MAKSYWLLAFSLGCMMAGGTGPAMAQEMAYPSGKLVVKKSPPGCPIEVSGLLQHVRRSNLILYVRSDRQAGADVYVTYYTINSTPPDQTSPPVRDDWHKLLFRSAGAKHQIMSNILNQPNLDRGAVIEIKNCWWTK
jgi:hypothetical protein